MATCKQALKRYHDGVAQASVPIARHSYKKDRSQRSITGHNLREQLPSNITANRALDRVPGFGDMCGGVCGGVYMAGLFLFYLLVNRLIGIVRRQLPLTAIGHH